MQHFYRGSKLPHWQPPTATFFVTARLYGSIPKTVIEQIKDAYQLALLEIQKANFRPDNADLLLPDELRQAIERMRRKKENAAGKRYFGQFDAFLDAGLNEPYWLQRPDIARLNAENIHFYAEKYFDLWAYTIMSNHIHLLLTLRPGAPMLWKVLQNMKKYSGLHSNRLLGRTGHFWEEESYDHWLRPGEFDRVLRYILNNPVKAGIVPTWQEHPWTYCNPALL
ncbi:MAG: transposase [Saprospiraceae bacterium]